MSLDLSKATIDALREEKEDAWSQGWNARQICLERNLDTNTSAYAENPYRSDNG